MQVLATSCGKSYFEGLLQLTAYSTMRMRVVESPILKDYYNASRTASVSISVVESPILKDYYNYLGRVAA